MRLVRLTLLLTCELSSCEKSNQNQISTEKAHIVLSNHGKWGQIDNPSREQLIRINIVIRVEHILWDSRMCIYSERPT